MEIRPYRHEDEGRVTDFLRAQQQEIEPPHPENPLNGVSLLAFDAGRLVALGNARSVLEGVVVLDSSWHHGSREGPREKLDVVNSLLLTGGMVGASRGFQELYVFTDNRRFAERLAVLPGAHARARYHLGFRLGGAR